MNTPVTVVGNTVAALAGAERLAAHGRRVELLCTGVPGGAFAPMDLDGRRVGVGLRLIEREYVTGENNVTGPPMTEHVPGHAGHRPWMGLVEEYLRDLVPDLTVSPTPQLFLNRRLTEDFTLTGRLDAIRDVFSPSQLAQIARQAEAARLFLGADEGIFAASHEYERATLRTASIANHGPLFHRLVVEPLADALIPGGAGIVSAQQRHKIWAPLYWPATLLAAASEGAVAFAPDRRFWTDSHGGMSDVARELIARLESSNLVRIVHPGRLTAIASMDGTTVMRFTDQSTHRAVAPVIGVSPTELFAAAGVDHDVDRVTINIAWVDVAERDVRHVAPTTLIASDVSAFRVVAGPVDAVAGEERRSFSVELKHGAAPTAHTAGAALLAAGIVDDPADIELIGHRCFPAFATPTNENRLRFELAHEQLRGRLSNVSLIGPAAGYGADPLNEQLFGGLRAALEASNAHV